MGRLNPGLLVPVRHLGSPCAADDDLSAAYAARASEAAALERAAADRKLKAAAAAAAKERDRLSSVIKDPTGKKNKEAGDAALREGRFKEATVHFAAGLEAFGVFEEVSFVEDDK